MVYNLFKTAAQGTFVANEAAEAPALAQETSEHKEYWHRVLEKKPIVFTVLATIAILIGGIFELIPTFLIKSNVPTISAVKPYTPLELHGRDIYIKEGCVSCHSQMVRPFRSETERYGEYSKAGEFVYDHPFLWGSKRTGPDLQRLGQKYPDSWHYRHMMDPGSMSPGSIMPSYPWLLEQTYDKSLTFYEYYFGADAGRGNTLVFYSLAMAQLFHIFSMWPAKVSFFKNETTRNPCIWADLGLCILILWLTYYPGFIK